MRELVIHIGMPKTGTTSLQATLSQISDDTIYYPARRANPERRLFINEWALHRFLSQQLVQPSVASLISNISGYSKSAQNRPLVLSDESIFTYWHVFGYEIFSELISGLTRYFDKITILYVKREWNEFIIAFYKEYQKHYTESNLRFLARRTMKFDDWVENPLTQKLHETYLNLEHQLLQCKMIDTRSYRYSSHINNQILEDIGIVSEKKDIPKENTSFSNVDSEILRLFNQWHYSKNAKEALISLLIPKEFDLSSYSLKSLGERTNSGYLELTYFLRMLQYFIPQKSKKFVVETEVFVSRIEYLANLVEEKTHIKL